MPRKYRKSNKAEENAQNIQNTDGSVLSTDESVVNENDEQHTENVSDNIAENVPENTAENVEPKTSIKQFNTEDKEIKLDTLFKVQNSTNVTIDNELNRIWGYLKINHDREKKIEALCKTLDSINEDFNKFKKEIKEETKKNAEEAKKGAEDIDVSSIIKKVSKELFSSKDFMNLFTEEIMRELRKMNKISLLYNGDDIKSARFEFGFAKKGKVVFFNKAFKNVFWHLPSEITMVTNTGFVALKDSFWIVIGEDTEN